MKNISFFFTLCSSWRTGRWFLATSLILLFFCLFTPDIILRHVFYSSADYTRNGWWMHFYEPSHPVDIEGYKTFIGGCDPLALNPDFKHSRGYLIWDVPVDGQYSIKLAATEAAALAVDGKRIASLQDRHIQLQRVDTWVSLSKGQHLFQIQLDNLRGDGVFSVGMMIPPMMNYRLLQGKDVTAPMLNSLDSWWFFLQSLHTGKIVFLYFSIFFILCLCLPFTLKNRIFSVIITIAIALAPSLLIPVTLRREPYIGDMIHKELQEKQPDFVFIGNSMLWSRIEDAYLEKLLDGKKVYSIINFGGLSAIHYLSFKYLFIKANITPKRVFIFFRSNQFILPKMRTTDQLVLKTVERLTPSPDPIYEQIIHGHSRSLTQEVYDALLNIFPISGIQETARTNLNKTALFMASLWQQNNGSIAKQQQEMLRLTNLRFSITSGSLRADIDTESTQKEQIENSYDLYDRVEGSFLPHILQLARDKDISLAFIRVQDRPSKDGRTEDAPELKAYMQDLRQYLTDNNALLYDFTGDPELPLSAYHDGDHIKDQKKYTELFFRRVGDLLQ